VTAVGGLLATDLITELAGKKPISPTVQPNQPPRPSTSGTDGRVVLRFVRSARAVDMDGLLSVAVQQYKCRLPGLGLGATVCGAKAVIDRRCTAEALATFVSDESLP
jgi:hypothetical protein